MKRKSLLISVVLLLTSLSILTIGGNAQTRKRTNSQPKKTTTPIKKPYSIVEEPDPEHPGVFTYISLKPLLVVNDGRNVWWLTLRFAHRDDWSDVGKMNVVEFAITSVSNDWKYANYGEITIMADGEKQYIFSQGRKPASNGNLVQERMIAYLLASEFPNIANSSRIDVELGINRYQLPVIAINAMRDFARKMNP